MFPDFKVVSRIHRYTDAVGLRNRTTNLNGGLKQMKKLTSSLIILACMLCLLATSAMAQPGGGPGAGGPGMGGPGGRQEMGQGGNRDRSPESRANHGNNQNEAGESSSRNTEKQGQMPQNQMPQGQMPQGQMPQGQMPQGQMPQGQMPQGQMPQGQMPQGQMPQGQMPQGQMPQGQMPQGQMPQSQPGFDLGSVNGTGAPMGPGPEGQPADNFDELVKNGVIDQETYEGILAYMQTNRPVGQMLPPQTQDSGTTEKPEEPAELLSDLLSAGIITQDQYDAIVAARPDATQTTEVSEAAE
jgi:hypothetical protein